MSRTLIFAMVAAIATTSVAFGNPIAAPSGIPKAWKDRAAVVTNWRYDSSRDAMRNQTTYFACITSSNQLQFDFPYNGGSDGELCLRKSPEYGKDVYLTINKGQFICSFDGCVVHIKFDEGKIQAFSAVEAADGTTNVIFIRGYSQFQRSLRAAKHMTVEAQYFQEGEQQLTFDVHGFAGVH